MVDLIPQAPCADLRPLDIGRCRLEHIDLARLTSIAPFAGQADDVAAILTQAHGLELPSANRSTSDADARLMWFGQDVFLLAGPVASPDLDRHAALTDQSDAWATFTLSGADSVDVLARLVPVDLRAAQFGAGHTVRTLLGHMTVSLTRVDAETVLILVFRSMAQTLIHELKVGMEALAARG